LGTVSEKSTVTVEPYWLHVLGPASGSVPEQAPDGLDVPGSGGGADDDEFTALAGMQTGPLSGETQGTGDGSTTGGLGTALVGIAQLVPPIRVPGQGVPGGLTLGDGVGGGQ
jgi:hypothetical protein